MDEPSVPRWESGEGWVRAVCEPDGYCADGHKCGKLDLGIVRADEPSVQGFYWYHGPTFTDPDPGKMWHHMCGGEVWSFDEGLICRRCGQGDE